LKSIDADIIALQELDISCERSGSLDIGLEIAKALNLNYVFQSEFEELHSPMREKHIQGGGVHGNGILTKFDMTARGIDHKYQPYNWDLDGHLVNEPRRGRRFTLVADIKTNQGEVSVYCTHFEVFCGILGRISQFSEILADARVNSSNFKNQMILGDFNTMAHSIARLSSLYCRDHLRWKTIGMSEGDWLERNVLEFHEEYGEKNIYLEGLGLPDQVLIDCRNFGFYDPFDVHADFTLSNHWGIYYGKLDWVLLRGFEVLNKRIDNHKYTASDHKCLIADIKPSESINKKYYRGKRNQTTTHWKIMYSLALVILLIIWYIF